MLMLFRNIQQHKGVLTFIEKNDKHGLKLVGAMIVSEGRSRYCL